MLQLRALRPPPPQACRPRPPRRRGRIGGDVGAVVRRVQLRGRGARPLGAASEVADCGMGSNSSAWACDERRRRVARAPSPLRPARGRGGRRPELTPERNDTSERSRISGNALRAIRRTSPTGGTPTGGGRRNGGARSKNHAPTWASRKSPNGSVGQGKSEHSH